MGNPQTPSGPPCGHDTYHLPECVPWLSYAAEAAEQERTRIAAAVRDLPTTHSHDRNIDILGHPFISQSAVLALIGGVEPSPREPQP